MGKDKDFSVFIKSGHVLYFFLFCLFLFYPEKIAILQYNMYSFQDYS